MDHVREMLLRDPDGKRFYFTGPNGDDSIFDSSQRKPADAVKEAAHCNLGHSITPNPR